MRYCILQYFCSRSVSSLAFICVQIGCVRSHLYLNKLLISQARIIRISHRTASQIWCINGRFILLTCCNDCINVIVVEQNGQTLAFITTLLLKWVGLCWVESLVPPRDSNWKSWLVCVNYFRLYIDQYRFSMSSVKAEVMMTFPWRTLVKFN